MPAGRRVREQAGAQLLVVRFVLPLAGRALDKHHLDRLGSLKQLGGVPDHRSKGTRACRRTPCGSY